MGPADTEHTVHVMLVTAAAHLVYLFTGVPPAAALEQQAFSFKKSLRQAATTRLPARVCRSKRRSKTSPGEHTNTDGATARLDVHCH